MSTVLDERAQRTKPKSILFTIAGGTIACDNGNTIGVKRTEVWARAGGKAVFTIQNNDDDAVDVRIPFNEFLPSREHGGDAPPAPIDDRATPRDTIRVQPRDVEVLTYVIKPGAHFHDFKKAPAYTYKYTLYYTNVRTRETIPEDPDLEVSA